MPRCAGQTSNLDGLGKTIQGLAGAFSAQARSWLDCHHNRALDFIDDWFDLDFRHHRGDRGDFDGTTQTPREVSGSVIVNELNVHTAVEQLSPMGLPADFASWKFREQAIWLERCRALFSIE